MAAPVIDDPPPSAEERARETYALARALAIAINAITAGLVATAFFAVLLLWLQRQSGIDLEKSQYAGVLIFIFIVISLFAYLVFDFFQTRKEKALRNQRAATAKKKQRPVKTAPDPDDWGAILEERLKAFDPLFAETADDAQTITPQPAAGKFDTKATVSDAPNAAPLTAAVQANAAVPTSIKDPTVDLFVQAVMAGVASLDNELSPFGQFGVNLFVAGGAGELVKRGVIAPTLGKKLLAAMLADMGLGKRSAEAFSANANVFAQVPHFRAPLEAGYRAMAQLIQDGKAEITMLPDVLGLWHFQADICKAPELMTFVTTSVGVPPPGIVVTPEDQQRVLRTHRTVITEVLHRFQGRELHNLGNGCIMVFDDATRALRAAQMCQEELDKFARANPNLTVAARIGVDTDIAAIVAHDYVSAALPRTVTITTLTPAGQIYCSESTKDDALDSIAYTPVVLSDVFADLPVLFSVVWSQAPVHTVAANPLEYRQVGAMAEGT